MQGQEVDLMSFDDTSEAPKRSNFELMTHAQSLKSSDASRSSSSSTITQLRVPKSSQRYQRSGKAVTADYSHMSVEEIRDYERKHHGDMNPWIQAFPHFEQKRLERAIPTVPSPPSFRPTPALTSSSLSRSTQVPPNETEIALLEALQIPSSKPTTTNYVSSVPFNNFGQPDYSRMSIEQIRAYEGQHHKYIDPEIRLRHKEENKRWKNTQPPNIATTTPTTQTKTASSKRPSSSRSNTKSIDEALDELKADWNAANGRDLELESRLELEIERSKEARLAEARVRASHNKQQERLSIRLPSEALVPSVTLTSKDPAVIGLSSECAKCIDYGSICYYCFLKNKVAADRKEREMAALFTDISDY